MHSFRFHGGTLLFFFVARFAAPRAITQPRLQLVELVNSRRRASEESPRVNLAKGNLRFPRGSFGTFNHRIVESAPLIWVAPADASFDSI